AHGGGLLPLRPDRPRGVAPEPASRARPAPPGGAGRDRLPERARRTGAGDWSAAAVRVRSPGHPWEQDTPKGRNLNSPGRQPRVGVKKNPTSPEGAAGSGVVFGCRPFRALEIYRDSPPGAGAPGYSNFASSRRAVSLLSLWERRAGEVRASEGISRHLACLFLALLVLPACHPAAEEAVDTAETVPVKVATASGGLIRPLVAATGEVKPAPGAELLVMPPQEARIAELPKSLGDRVRRGELLVRFEIPSLQADAAARRSDLARAQAQLETARQNEARVSGLFQRGIAARKEVEDARRDLAQAEASVTEARSAVAAASRLAGREVVRAPFAGVVVGRSHQPGDLVDPGAPEPILRVIDPSRLQVEAAVPAVDLGHIAQGNPARVHGPSFPDQQARVVARPAAVDSATGTALVRL